LCTCPELKRNPYCPNASGVGDKISPGRNQEIQGPRKARGRGKILMTSAIAHAFNPPQLETANLLKLVIVDDESTIHDVCREVAQSWVSTPWWLSRRNISTACSTRKP
jgi:hypothetical protein